jgi:DNA-binding transcriptional ArsR family regulator
MQVNKDVLPAVPIRSLETLRVLVDGQRHQIVTLLMEEALTAKELAERLGIGRTRLYYHLDLLLKHELIRIVETRVVSGIQERRYRAVARTYRVDRDFLGAQVSGAEIAGAQSGIIDAVAADLRTLAADDPDMLVNRTFLHLNDAHRRELRTELQAVLDRYRDSDTNGRDFEFSMTLFALKEST